MPYIAETVIAVNNFARTWKSLSYCFFGVSTHQGERKDVSSLNRCGIVGWAIEFGHHFRKWKGRNIPLMRRNTTIAISVESLTQLWYCKLESRGKPTLTYFLRVTGSLLAVSRSTTIALASDWISWSREGWNENCGVRPPPLTIDHGYWLRPRWGSYYYWQDAYWVGVDPFCKTLQADQDHLALLMRR